MAMARSGDEFATGDVAMCGDGQSLHSHSRCLDLRLLGLEGHEPGERAHGKALQGTRAWVTDAMTAMSALHRTASAAGGIMSLTEARL